MIHGDGRSRGNLRERGVGAYRGDQVINSDAGRKIELDFALSRKLPVVAEQEDAE